MSGKFRNRLGGLIWFIAVNCLANAMTNPGDQPSLRLTVRAFNYVQIAPDIWKSAQIVTTRIFHQTGIETAWVDCSLSPEGKYMLPECDMPPHPTDIILRLVPACEASRTHLGEETLGIAALPSSATVFYDRVEQLAKGGAASVSVILGHATAHEIGHVLVGSNSHAHLGLMQVRWSRSDLQLAIDGKLLFSRRETLAVQEEVRRRSRPTAPTSSGSSGAPNRSDFRTSEGTLLETRVLVYNYAELTAEVLSEAEKRAEVIFQELGVKVVWVDIVEFKRQFPLNSPKEREELDSIDTALRISSQSRVVLGSSVLGEALPCQMGREACVANVFMNHIKKQTNMEKIGLDQVLGHAMAHEIGHVLLGSTSHSSNGLMKAKWGPEDMKRMGKGDLLFTRQEAQTIRSNVTKLARTHTQRHNCTALERSPSRRPGAEG